MNDHTKHVFLATALLLASIVTGCASLDVEGDGHNSNGGDIIATLHDDSQGK
jgi:hypothetical protein